MIVAASTAAAAPTLSVAALPTFDGGMTFQSIKDPTGPEEFSWEVTLSGDQELLQVDDQHAMVYYTENHHPAFGISAVSAHDAIGAEVPTSLTVSDGNVITLTVRHRAGNPLLGGAPFTYPIDAGSGWVNTGPGHVVVMPLPEGVIEEVNERIEKANRGWPAANRGHISPRCRVPRLKDRSLRASMRRIKQANCSVGQIRKRRGVTAGMGEVVRQHPAAGTLLARGAAVDLTLGK